MTIYLLIFKIGSYIYLYKEKRDLMPNHFVYLADSQISSFDDLQELPEIQNKQTDFKNALLVCIIR